MSFRSCMSSCISNQLRLERLSEPAAGGCRHYDVKVVILREDAGGWKRSSTEDMTALLDVKLGTNVDRSNRLSMEH